MAKKAYDQAQLHELLYQALETEMGGIDIAFSNSLTDLRELIDVTDRVHLLDILRPDPVKGELRQPVGGEICVVPHVGE